jgi:deoxyadenosine/deoxycytidine kinase
MSLCDTAQRILDWRGYVFAFAGPIGVGKSTLLKLLAQGGLLQRELNKAVEKPLRVTFLFENIEEWERPVEGAPGGMLKWFYEDPKTRGFEFQLYVFDQYVDTFWDHVERNRPDVIVCERFMTCQKIFADIQPWSAPQRRIYDSHWRKWTALVPAPDLMFRMETKSERTLMKRLRRRAREGETPVQRRKPIRKSDSGIFLNGDQHEPYHTGTTPRDDLSEEDVDDRSDLMFSMDGREREQSSSDEEVEEEDAKTEDGAGVTLEYQRKLLKGHREVYPVGPNSPFNLPVILNTVVMDADPAYHLDPQLMRKTAQWIAEQMSGAIRRRQYKQI